VLNGEDLRHRRAKSLVRPGFVVVWATIDPSSGRAGMRPFVVEAGTPGVSVTKLEHKLGIRASDTASVVLQDCRIPFGNILGSAEVAKEKSTETGFKGAMATFVPRGRGFPSAMGIAGLVEQSGAAPRHNHPLHARS
jgi:acyl-CoA dehydrogenase